MDFFCQSVPNQDPVGLCVPVSANDTSFYVATPPGTDPGLTQSEIRRKFRTDSYDFEAVKGPNGETNIGTNARFFDVTRLIPDFIRKHIFKNEAFHGPNCYFAALSASGVLQNDIRYVDDLEFSFYLTRDFEPARPDEGLMMGAIIVFRTHPNFFGFETANPAKVAPLTAKPFCSEKKVPGCFETASRSHLPSRLIKQKGMNMAYGQGDIPTYYESGSHAAFSLPSGFIFHKLTWRRNARYEVVPFKEATKNLDYSVWSNLDRFERSRTVEYRQYYPFFYVKRKDPIHLPKKIEVPSPIKNYYIAMFDFYIELMSHSENYGSSDTFAKNRPNLITIENVWGITDRFEEEVLKSTPGNLLLIDKELSEKFLKLVSLYWQYEAVKDNFDFKGNGNATDSKRYSLELYKNHYLRDIDSFKKEVYLHLALMGVQPEKREEAFAKFMKLVAKDMPVVLETAMPGTRIDFFGILKKVTSSF